MTKIGNEGYVKLVDMMGNDMSPANAARISYDGSSKGAKADEGLTRYLLVNRHTSPFEQIELQWEVQAPIFVFRQWHRHRTASLNEMSGRYTKLPDVYYIPDVWRAQDTKNKQGSDGVIGPLSQSAFTQSYTNHISEGFALYQRMIDAGISKEMARFHLPVSTYSKMIWKSNLHNTWHFLGLRLDPHAQQEIREYAEAMRDIMREQLPMLMRIWEETR